MKEPYRQCLVGMPVSPQCAVVEIEAVSLSPCRASWLWQEPQESQFPAKSQSLCAHLRMSGPLGRGPALAAPGVGDASSA